MQRLTIIFALITTLHACSDDQGQTATISQGITGIWSGSYTPVQKKGAALIEPKKVSLRLSNDKQFHINLVRDVNSFAKGAYQDRVKSKNLMFEVKESSLHDFGKASNVREFDYQMRGSELELKGSTGRYILVKEDEGEDQEKGMLEGEWHCSTGNQASWVFNIDNPVFQGSRKVPNSSTLFFSGEVVSITQETIEEAEAILQIKQSNDVEKQGVRLRATMTAAERSSIVQIDENGEKADQAQDIPCQRRAD